MVWVWFVLLTQMIAHHRSQSTRRALISAVAQGPMLLYSGGSISQRLRILLEYLYQDSKKEEKLVGNCMGDVHRPGLEMADISFHISLKRTPP